jgi:hypothetical protein
MLDIVQVILWSIAYILIILAQIFRWKEKELAIPIAVVVSNMAWELTALILVGGWAHWLWTGLDLIILVLALRTLGKWQWLALALGAIAAVVAVYLWLFTVPKGMLYSSFVIDLFMAVCFLVWRRKLSSKLAVAIAASKLLGDICAGLHYGQSDMLIAVIAVAVLLCNVMDLFFCLEKKNKP